MKYGQGRKTVVFNLNNETERHLSQFADSINFSHWAKQNLLRDWKRQKQQSTGELRVTLRGDSQ